MVNEIFSVTHYETLKDVFWPFQLQKTIINVKKKFCKNNVKIRDVKTIPLPVENK